MLTLADLTDWSEADIKSHLVRDWSGEEPSGSYEGGRQTPETTTNAEAWLETAEVLVAYESVGDYGCDSSGFYLFRRDGKLYEVHGGHCSCYGFEGQFCPEETSLAYLQSDKFRLDVGGYDSESVANAEKVKAFVMALSA